MPRDASLSADGFRYYSWPGGDTDLNRKYNATQEMALLSVTSIRSLVGEPFQLVAWKIANVVNLAMGTRKVTRIGPRGGINKVLVKDGPFPGEFVTRMMESRGNEEKLDLVRKWLRETADEPRDVAAVRGSVVHKMIEANTPLSRANAAAVHLWFENQWKLERRKVKPDITDEDVDFVVNCMRQYWNMRVHVPFVILAQEPQVWAPTLGYGGSADVLVWFLGDCDAAGNFVPLPGVDINEMIHWQSEAAHGRVTLETIAETGGTVALGDWKTAVGINTSHIVQGTAYMAAEFVASAGIIDERLTDILRASRRGMIIHIRPNQCTVDFFDFNADVVYAFYGSVAFARFLARYPKPDELFTHSISMTAPGTESSTKEDDD